MAVLIWYPKCSTCQKAKKKLEALGVEVETRSIVEQTPTVEELRRWMAMGDLTLKQLYNVSGNLYKELNMKERRLQMSEDEQLTLLSEHGMLAEAAAAHRQSDVLVGYREAAYEAFAEKENKRRWINARKGPRQPVSDIAAWFFFAV
ncbi:MAG: ArsC/Spx/MgsR family protein [Merdibacter sp.]